MAFADDCVGADGRGGGRRPGDGGVALLENLRFHAGEEANDPAFAAAAGRARRPLRQRRLLRRPPRPRLDRGAGRACCRPIRAWPCSASWRRWTRRWATRSGRCSASSAAPRSRPSSTCSKNLVAKLDKLAIGGGMANTFLYAQGIDVGASCARRTWPTPRARSWPRRQGQGCELLLPVDVVVAEEVKPGAADAPSRPGRGRRRRQDPRRRPGDRRAADARHGRTRKTLIWNGPLGVFEMPPFDAATVEAAHARREAAPRPASWSRWPAAATRWRP